MMFSTFHQPI